MSTSYSHSQFGTLVVATIIPVMVLLLAIYVMTGFLPFLPFVFVAFLLLTALFYRLEVEVTRELVVVRFGVGLVRKTFATADIVGALPVRNKWWYGFGIRLTPHGWLFNVSGLDAVEIAMRCGKHYRIGTNEPVALARAVSAVIEGSK